MKYLLITVLIEAIYIFLSTKKPGPYQMRGIVVINMILITAFAPKLFSAVGLTSNIGNIFYAAVALIQALILRMYGKEEALKTIPMTLFALSAFIFLSESLSMYPAIGPAAEYIDKVADSAIGVVAASFLAFAIGQYVYVTVFSWIRAKYQKNVAYLPSVICLQVVDSFIFFPLAFGSQWDWYGIMMAGLLIKIVVGVLFWPMYLYLIRSHDNITT